MPRLCGRKRYAGWYDGVMDTPQPAKSSQGPGRPSGTAEPVESPAVPSGLDLCLAFERLGEAILIADTAGRLVMANQAARELLGYSQEELLGQRLSDLTPSTPFWSAAGGPGDSTADKLRAVEVPITRKDGGRITVEARAADLGDGHIIISLRDVSDGIERKADLRQAGDRPHKVLGNLQTRTDEMPLAHIVWGGDCRVMEWGPEAEQLFGYSRAEALGKTPNELIVPAEEASAPGTVWAGLATGTGSNRFVADNVRQDGTRLTCEWFIARLVDADGRIQRVCSMAVDVSAREAMELQLRMSQKLESLGVLASGVAHDFNSSLAVILGNAALLRSVDGLSDEALALLESIEDAGFQARDFIGHLLRYARTGRYNPLPAGLNAIVYDALKLICSSIGGRDQLDLQLAEGLPPILADKGQVEQILLNLCLNAYHAISGKGIICITTQLTDLTAAQALRCTPHGAKAGRYVELAVADNGCGMDESTIQRVFDPFFTTKVEGHGLGLAAVHGILRQHHAHALVESAVGKGTVVRVFFPASQKADEAESV